MGLAARLACISLVVLVTRVSAEPTPQQRIAVTAKPSVVRVWGAYVATFELAGEKFQHAIGGSGTGFFITADGYIATNAHVVSDIHEGDDKAKKRLRSTLIDELDRKYAKELAQLSDAQVAELLRSIKLVDLQKRAYVVLPSGDKLDYTITQYGKPGSGRDAAIIKVATHNAPTLPIGDSTRAQVADPIVVLGYPGVADMKVLLDKKSQLQASVTDGSISSLKRATSGEQILQISAPITHGNSGGPALDLNGNVVGLATFGNESEIQGFNFLVASATLLELVKDAKLTPAPSDTNKVWERALKHYWADEYTAAIAKLEEVQKLYPQHSEAAGLITLSQQAKKEGKEKRPAATSDGALVAGVIGGVAVLGLVGFVALRRKRPGVPPPGMSAPPGMPMPHSAHVAHAAHAAHAASHGYPAPGGFAPPAMPPPGAPPHLAPPAMPPPVAQYGRVPPGHPPAPAGGIAPTAFGSLSIGSLTCVRGALTGERFALTATGLIVGRQPGVAHILVNDHRASGKHVWIGLEQGRLVAIDQGTTNGTFINDVQRGRITRAELRDGDVIIVSEPDCLSLQLKLQ